MEPAPGCTKKKAEYTFFGDSWRSWLDKPHFHFASLCHSSHATHWLSERTPLTPPLDGLNSQPVNQNYIHALPTIEVLKSGTPGSVCIY